MSALKPRLNFASVIEEDAPDAPRDNQVERMNQRDRDRNFTSRETEEREYRNARETEPKTSLSIRPPVSVANRFIRFCKAERLNYPEALEILMNHRGI